MSISELPTFLYQLRLLGELVGACNSIEVSNYSHCRDLGINNFLRSAVFEVGGCAWSIRFYPYGRNRTPNAKEGYVTVALELITTGAVATVTSRMHLIDCATGARYSATEACRSQFDTRCHVDSFSRGGFVTDFMMKSEVESSSYLRDNGLMIECVLRMIKGTRAARRIPVPPSDLPDQLGRLLKEGMGTDVTINVQGVRFAAHRLLAARSWVFRALLHFISTDSLPAMDDVDKDELVRRLLTAADRYAMDRLKLVCEETLSRSLTAENVSDLLVMADRHTCSGLKDACMEFLASNRRDEVTRTEGYANLKRDHPYVLIEALDKAVKLRKI